MSTNARPRHTAPTDVGPRDSMPGHVAPKDTRPAKGGPRNAGPKDVVVLRAKQNSAAPPRPLVHTPCHCGPLRTEFLRLLQPSPMGAKDLPSAGHAT